MLSNIRHRTMITPVSPPLTRLIHISRIRRDTWGGIWGICSPEIFKTLHSNFDICRNFQRIKMKFYILIIFMKFY